MNEDDTLASLQTKLADLSVLRLQLSLGPRRQCVAMAVTLDGMSVLSANHATLAGAVSDVFYRLKCVKLEKKL